ncbi:MAG: hypothetical protein KME26_26535 [Oscillatoria princeps RMCB-10]|jgi:hypothetical protein|nr:hypothetical protein [Oscillatoria princeps RMCB-10]
MAVNLFDANFYRAINPDLRGLSDGQALQHLLDFGLNEGRVFSQYVDFNVYRSSNPDLAAAGLTTNRQLYDHLLNLGVAEGRQFSSVFNALFYRNANPDLASAGLNNEQLFDHFRNFGVSEGRQASESFSVSFYLANNPDLRQAGLNNQQAVQHFVLNGIREGRIASPPLPSNVLFFEDFESPEALSRWTGKSRGEHSGILVTDPLQGDRALSFTDFGSGGDIFTLQSFSSPSEIYRLSFDYLGLARPQSEEGDLGGFVGYGATLSGNADLWLAGTGKDSINLSPDFRELPDTGQWESISIPFATAESIHLTFEDFVSSGGIAGDVYFDNIRLEAL